MRAIFNIPAIIVLSLMVSACDNVVFDNGYQGEIEFSDARALMLVEEALSYSTAGFTYDLIQSAKVAEVHLSGSEVYDSCGQSLIVEWPDNIEGLMEHTSAKTKRVACDSENIPTAVTVEGDIFPGYPDDNSEKSGNSFSKTPFETI